MKIVETTKNLLLILLIYNVSEVSHASFEQSQETSENTASKTMLQRLRTLPTKISTRDILKYDNQFDTLLFGDIISIIDLLKDKLSEIEINKILKECTEMICAYTRNLELISLENPEENMRFKENEAKIENFSQYINEITTLLSPTQPQPTIDNSDFDFVGEDENKIEQKVTADINDKSYADPEVDQQPRMSATETDTHIESVDNKLSSDYDNQKISTSQDLEGSKNANRETFEGKPASDNVLEEKETTESLDNLGAKTESVAQKEELGVALENSSDEAELNTKIENKKSEDVTEKIYWDF